MGYDNFRWIFNLGSARRFCTRHTSWSPPNLYNCTSLRFAPFDEWLSELENGVDLAMAQRLASQLQNATSEQADMYGRDIYISYRIIMALVRNEQYLKGLEMTHNRDKHFISVSHLSMYVIFQHKLRRSPIWEFKCLWAKIKYSGTVVLHTHVKGKPLKIPIWQRTVMIMPRLIFLSCHSPGSLLCRDPEVYINYFSRELHVWPTHKTEVVTPVKFNLASI